MTWNEYNSAETESGSPADDFPGFTYELEEPITLKGFAVTYDRKFNLGNFEALNPAITIWVKTAVAEGQAFDLHHARERLRKMARENVRAQYQRLQGDDELVFLQGHLQISFRHRSSCRRRQRLAQALAGAC